MKFRNFSIYMIFCTLILINQSGNATIQEEGRGLLFGDEHAFSVKAKSGWVLDNQSGVNQGLHMVFYPKNSTWRESKVIIYGRTISVLTAPTIKEHVNRTIEDFISKGSLNFNAIERGNVPLKNNKEAKIYFYTGDKFGNYEAVAYIKELDSINFIVYSARDKETFEHYIDDFYNIIGSYRNLYTSPNGYDLEKLKKFERLSKNITKTELGKEYETEAMKAIGRKMSNVLQSCSSYMKNRKIPMFSYYVHINKKGYENATLISPANTIANCFSGLMSDSIYPKHNLDNVVLKYVFNFE